LTVDLDPTHGWGSLVVETSNGGVRVGPARAGVGSGSDVPSIPITAEIRATSAERLAAVRIQADRDGSGALRVRVEWPGGEPRGSEGCSFEIESSFDGVSVRTSNGAIRLRDCRGRAALETSNGSIELDAHTGPVQAKTSNGSVRVTEPGGPVEIETSNGSVRVGLARVSPGPVRIETSNGSIELTVGPAFRGTVHADTSNGSVRMDLADPNGGRITIPSGASAKAQVGTGGGLTTLRTSNGSIRVTSAAP
jgi:hypothetical protein